LAGLKKSDVAEALKDDTLPGEARVLLAARQEASKTSVKKYNTLVHAAGVDGRLRGGLQFCGAARTGRWAGRLFQPQNLFRQTMALSANEFGIEALKAGCEDLFYD
jgi:DNA polymerase